MSFLFTFKKILSIIILLVIVLSICIAPILAKAEEAKNEIGMEFECESAVLMEATTGTVLYQKNPDKALPPASVTKIMTLLLVMQEINDGKLKYDDKVTTSAYAASMGGSQVFLEEGEVMSVEDMLKSVVISSANDAAVALAEHICGSEEAFVKRMNTEAQKLGMSNTNFENTNGLDDTATRHVTSAIDIAIMSRELIKYDDILKYSSTWMDTIRNGEFTLTNTNRLVRFYQGATGLKTGSTSKAKFCISATAKRGNMHLICVVMGAPSSDVRNSIATKLLNWGFANYELLDISSKQLSPIKVLGGTESFCQIETCSFSTVLEKGSTEKIESTYVLPNTVSAPIAIGDEIGYVEYKVGSKVVGKAPIVSTVNIERIDYWALFIKILSKFVIK